MSSRHCIISQKYSQTKVKTILGGIYQLLSSLEREKLFKLKQLKSPWPRSFSISIPMSSIYLHVVSTRPATVPSVTGIKPRNVSLMVTFSFNTGTWTHRTVKLSLPCLSTLFMSLVVSNTIDQNGHLFISLTKDFRSSWDVVRISSFWILGLMYRVEYLGKEIASFVIVSNSLNNDTTVRKFPPCATPSPTFSSCPRKARFNEARQRITPKTRFKMFAHKVVSWRLCFSDSSLIVFPCFHLR